MLQYVRERLVLVLIAVLPFHAFLVTVGTKTIAGAGHAPLPMLAVWKEGVLGVILGIALAEIVIGIRSTVSGEQTAESNRRSMVRLDILDMCIIALCMIALVLFAFGKPASLSAFVFGFRYDFVPLIAFMVLRRVTWSADFLHRALRVVLVVAVIVAGYGLIAATLPQSLFTRLGYSDLHSLYLPGGPIAAFQQIGGSALRRVQSVMSGPNQLGLWLLLPFAVALLRRRPADVLLILLAVFATLSRSALLGVFVIMTIVLWRTLSHKRFFQLAAGSFVLGVFATVIGGSVFSDVILRKASSSDHIARPIAALRMIAVHPLGYGLASAGPASNRISDACVHLEVGSDASWASDRPDLCVFVGDEQAQPIGRTCRCPFLPENWYLQIGVEMGVLGMLIFIMFIVLVLITLAKSYKLKAISYSVFLAFLGVSIAAFFLHAWEDSALSYTLWILVAVLLPVTKKVR